MNWSVKIPDIVDKFNKLFNTKEFINTFNIKNEDTENSNFFKKKKYPDHKLKIFKEWINYEYKNNRFDKWNHKIYMQVFEWALNTNLPKDMKSKCESLIIAYMTYLITNKGDRSIPLAIKKLTISMLL